ncbi:MAG: MoxR family ATPase, partial [Planctomycetota bacterium]|nr:MoxR family ATPase [Planctomycetota bacterium]
INRTPPKTQAALMEAMEERQVTVGGKRYKLDHPFFVLATQNPIEQEGTYPLPAAQLDRFMFMVYVDYPDKKEEYEILRLTTTRYIAKLEPLLTKEEIISLMNLVLKVRVPDEVNRYAVTLARLTRPKEVDAPEFVKEYVAWGVGPRAPQALILGSKARAMLHGRYEISFEDIRSLVHPVFRHRLITNFHADAEGVSSDHIIEKLLATVPSPDRPVMTKRKRRSSPGTTGGNGKT